MDNASIKKHEAKLMVPDTINSVNDDGRSNTKDRSFEDYWEKGLLSVSLVADILSAKATYKKIKAHFGYTEED